MRTTLCGHDGATPTRERGGPYQREHDLLIEGLTVTDAHSKTLLNGVSIDVPRGGSLGVVGPSGVGKSLLLRCAVGLPPAGVTPISGKIRLLDTIVEAPFASTRNLQRARQQIAYCSQDAYGHFVPDVKIARQVHALVRERGTDRAAVQPAFVERLAALGIVDIDQVLHAFPRQLSGGQLQRTQVAVALAAMPRVLFLDEPTSSLDPVNVDRVIDVLINHRRQHGTTVLLASHDDWLVQSLCDRVVHIDAGGKARTT